MTIIVGLGFLWKGGQRWLIVNEVCILITNESRARGIKIMTNNYHDYICCKHCNACNKQCSVILDIVVTLVLPALRESREQLG